MELSKQDKIIFISELWGYADYKSMPYDTEEDETNKAPDIQSLHDHLKRQTINDFCELIYLELSELAEKYCSFVVGLLGRDEAEDLSYYKEKLFVKYDDVVKVINNYIDQYSKTSNKAKEKLLLNTKNDTSLVDMYDYLYVKMFYDMLNEIEPLTIVLEQFDEDIAAKLNR